MKKVSSLLKFGSLLILLWTHIEVFSTQRTIELNPGFEEIILNDIALGMLSPISSQTTSEQIWSFYHSNPLQVLSAAIDKSKLEIGKYDVWMVFKIKNVSTEPIPILVKSAHAPLLVQKMADNTIQEIEFMGHAAIKDPNSIIEIKERNAFTSVVSPGKEEIFLIKLNIIEAGESKIFTLYDAKTYSIKKLIGLQWITYINGIFIGLQMMFLLCSLYIYMRIKQRFLLWYMGYLLIFIFYYWRDFEFWNTHLDLTHQYLSWYATKTPITLIIFGFYLLFMNGILNISHYPVIARFNRQMLWSIPFIFIIDLFLVRTYPYGSIILAYATGLVLGIIQWWLIFPIWKISKSLSTRFLILGSLSLFIGWLTILLLPVTIHQFTVRFFTLLEMFMFMLAIAERFLVLSNEFYALKMEKENFAQAERIKISGEMHDDLGGTLSGISIYSHLIDSQIKTGEYEKAINTTQVIQKSINEVTQNLRDMIWSFNSDLDNLNGLQERITEYGMMMSQSKGIQFNSTFDKTILPFPLPTYVRRDVYLILKEGINNAVKYSNAKNINLHILFDRDTLSFSLSDDGCGISMKEMKMGNGIENMHKRARKLNTTLVFHSSPDHGTSISFSCRTMDWESNQFRTVSQSI